MKNETYRKIVKNLKKCIKKNYSFVEFKDKEGVDLQTEVHHVRTAYKNNKLNEVDYNKLEELVHQVKLAKHDKVKTKEDVDNDERSNIEYILDGEGKISKYAFNIFTKDKINVKGELTREEMEKIFGMYSRYGANLSQAIVYQEFPRWSYVEFQRILRALQITKNGQLPEHLRRELTQSEQEDYYRNLRANNARKNFDSRKFHYLELDYKKALFENEELKNKLNDFANLTIPDVSAHVKSLPITQNKQNSEVDLMLHLSDWHIGAKTESNSLYPNKWNREECVARLDKVLGRIINLNMYFDTIIINNLGDCLDGMDMQTARRDHMLPQNMDNKEMINNFVDIFVEFIGKLNNLKLCNKIKIYSVPNGNHCGATEYVAIKMALTIVDNLYPEMEVQLFEQSMGTYSFKGKQFLIMHGKDDKFAKRGMPLNITDKVRCQIIDYLKSINFNFQKKIYVVKGDLHTANLNSDYNMDYRNVLSLFGNSDYANENFIRNPYGVSYSILCGNELIRGEFDFYE